MADNSYFKEMKCFEIIHWLNLNPIQVQFTSSDTLIPK